MSYVLSVTEIMDLIPNRYLIYYVDYVDTLEPRKKTMATKNVTVDEDSFQGRLPDNPVMPGALILETLAQAGSIPILRSEEFPGKRAYIGGINKAKFRRKVIPGDVLKYHFGITRVKGLAGTALSAAYVDDRKARGCELTFIINQSA